MMWMNLESVIQSEVSQKEKNKYHINAHMCIYMESRKMVLMKLMCRAVIRDTEQTRGHSKGRRRDNLREEPWHTYMPCVKRRLGEAVTWCGAQLGALWWPRRVGGGGRGGGSRQRGCVVQLVHSAVHGGWNNTVKQLYSNKKMSPDIAKCSLRRKLLPHLLRMLANPLKLDLWLSDLWPLLASPNTF